MLAYLFLLLAVATRFPEHPWSFTPIGAALLFFGARMPLRRLWIAVALLAGVDVYLTTTRYAYPLTWDHVVTWAWYAAVVALGSGVLKRNARPLRLAGAALATSISFFLVSNFAVWAVWNMYPKTAGGLMMSYAAALPFFRNTVASDLFFTALMFGIAALLAPVAGESEEKLAV